MCPLRLILIFLSATVAGFFVLRNLKSHHQTEVVDSTPITDDGDNSTNDPLIAPFKSQPASSVNQSFKVWDAICTGFRTCVDMASGRYLWKNLVSSTSTNYKPSN